jgi:hypothetical protein
VSLAWKDRRATSAELKASVAGHHRIRLPRGQRIDLVREGSAPTSITRNDDETVSLDIRAGQTYTLSFR